jgi:Flp pilus assembly protein TadG
MPNSTAQKTMFRKFRDRLRRDEGGNVFMIFGFAMLPMCAAMGMAIDYSKASRLQTRLNAAADAAVLAAVTQPMMEKTDDEAKAAARNMFNAQVQGLTGLVYDPLTNVTIDVNHTGVASLIRTVSINYTADSTNTFAGILGRPTLPIKGSSQSNGTAAPNIDFYVLMDTSPSMALPTTQAGLNKLYAQTGCAFACHQNSATTSDTTVWNGVRMDYYTYAVGNNIPLRIDNERLAVQDLADFAKLYAVTNNSNYQMAVYSFDKNFKTLATLTPNLTTARAGAGNAALYVPYANNRDENNVSDNDTQTNFTNAFTKILAAMPVNPGNGTRNAGDTPQAFLFIITDGMRDEEASGRKIGPIPLTQCATIKARGIRIAILNTEYLKESMNATDINTQNWVNANAKAYVDPTDKLGPAMTTCASPGLFYRVSTDQDISAALQSLFQKAVATARLTL